MRSPLCFLAVSLLAAFGVASSCTAGGGGGPDNASTSGSGVGASGGVGGGSSSASDGVGGDVTFTVGSGSGNGGVGGGCQHFDVVFEPQTPSVLVVVDRSGSMFDGGYWEPLKTAVLNVIMNVQDKVQFGLLTFTGIAGQQCPLITETDIALQNYGVIQAAYEAASTKPGAKLETPTGVTLNETAVPKLLDMAAPGGKYIVFVTDGEPDRCDDGAPECARDDVVGAVQSARAKGITTFVFGLGTAAFAQHLQDVANAGAGEPVASPGDGAMYTCFGGDWANAKGTYSPAGGAAKYFTPDPTDAKALETELSAAIAGTKSCSFDLQGKIEVNLDKASEGKVLIDGAPVPYDPQNGWSMESSTVLVLAGAACEQLKTATQGISVDFPCDILVPK